MTPERSKEEVEAKQVVDLGLMQTIDNMLKTM